MDLQMGNSNGKNGNLWNKESTKDEQKEDKQTDNLYKYVCVGLASALSIVDGIADKT